MADLTYPYLIEGAPFDASSLNTRFEGVAGAAAGLNAIMPYAAKRGAFQQVHLPATGVVAAEAFSSFTTTINPSTDQFVTSTYTTFGADAGREVLTDGAGTNLEVLIPAPGVTLGMGQPQKIGGLLILANVHFIRNTYVPEGEGEITALKPGKTAFMMALQYTTDGVNWVTNNLAKTERWQTERVVDNQWGEGPFNRHEGDLLTRTENDIWTYQDIPLRTWLDATNFNVNGIRGFRVVGAVVNLDPTASPPSGGWPASFTFRGYYREGNLSVIPFHTGNLS